MTLVELFALFWCYLINATAPAAADQAASESDEDEYQIDVTIDVKSAD